MALTASATPLYAAILFVSEFKFLPLTAENRVQGDIARILGMDSDRLFKFVHPFNRPNLFYEVRSFPQADSKCRECVRLTLVI